LKIINEKAELAALQFRISTLETDQCAKFTEANNNQIAILSVKLQTIKTRLKQKKYKV
jgi:hypothetical protein